MGYERSKESGFLHLWDVYTMLAKGLVTTPHAPQASQVGDFWLIAHVSIRLGFPYVLLACLGLR